MKLSAPAKGFLFLLRLLADRSVMLTRNTDDHGKIWDDEQSRFWVGADAEAWMVESHGAGAVEVAAWMGELVDGGFVVGGYDEEVVVADFVEDDRRKAGNLRGGASGERGWAASGFSGAGGYDGPAGGEGRFCGSQALANGGSSSPPPPPPMVREDAHGSRSTFVGGKGGVYSENIRYGKHQTPTTNPNFQTPFQTAREANQATANDGDGLRMEGGGGGGDEDFYAKIHSQNIFSAAEFACKQSDPVFRKAFQARLNHYGQDVVREALEYVALQVHRNPKSISYSRDGHAIGGPLLWTKMADVAASRGMQPYVRKGRFGL